jgi:hypothetical protein
MPEQIKPAPLDQILSGEAHDFTNLFPIFRFVAVYRTMLADRAIFERTTQAALKGIKKKIKTIITNRILVQRELLQLGLVT